MTFWLKCVGCGRELMTHKDGKCADGKKMRPERMTAKRMATEGAKYGLPPDAAPAKKKRRG